MLEKDILVRAIEDYLVNYSSEIGLEEGTIRNKRLILNKLKDFLKGTPYNLQSARAFVAHLTKGSWQQSSRLSVIKILRAFTNFLHRRKYIEENFAQELVKPKVNPKPFVYIPPETVERVIAAGVKVGVGDRSRSKLYKSEAELALKFILRTGLRIQETIELKGSDLNLEDDPLTFWVNSKGGNRELLPFPRDMVAPLKLRINTERLFKITEKFCNVVLKRGLEKLNIKAKLTCHSLRHIFASNLVKNKVPIQFVSRLMRHSSVEITDKTYTHLDITDLSLILNGSQTVVREGLSENQIFDLIINAIRSTGIEKDKRFKISFQSEAKKLNISLRVK